MPHIMSNNFSRLSLNKRPLNFLGNNPQGRTVAKKPKLDITSSQQSSSSVSKWITKDTLAADPNKSRRDVNLPQQSNNSNKKYFGKESSANVSAVDPYEDVWEDDLADDVVEECFLLATQASQSCVEDSRKPEEPNPGRGKSESKWEDTGHGSSGFLRPPPGSFGSKLGQTNSKSALWKPREAGSSEFKAPALVQSNKTQFPPPKFQVKKPSNLLSAAAAKLPPVQLSSGVSPSVTSSGVCRAVEKSAGERAGAEESSDADRIRAENERLRDSVQSKEGEVSLLRSQLKKLQLQLEMAHSESARQSQQLAKEYNEQIENYRKELEMTKTELQFKIIEATAVKTHTKLIESASNLKLIEPEAAMINTPSFSDYLRQRSPKKRCSHVLSKEDSGFGLPPVSKFADRLEELPQVSEGAKLGSALTDSLLESPSVEVEWMHYVRHTEKFRSTTEMAREINTKIVALQHHPRSVNDCVTEILRLVSCSSFTSCRAGQLTKRIVQVCREVICRQVHVLRLTKLVQSTAEWHELDESVAAAVSTAAASEDADPFSPRSWFRGEQGVEARRAFALLEAVCGVSQLAADLVSGSYADTNFPGTTSLSEGSASADSITRQIAVDGVRGEAAVASAPCGFSPDADSDLSLEAVASDPEPVVHTARGDSQDRCVDTQLHLLLKQPPAIPNITDPQKLPLDLSDYASHRYGVLRLCLEAVSLISVQRRTQSFVGVLTCMIRMLQSVALRSAFTKNGLQLVAEIVRETVFACPQTDVVAALMGLLAKTSQHLVLVDSLCHNSDSSTLVDRQVHEVIYFSRDSCVLQVLFRLVPVGPTSPSFRSSFCASLVSWLSGLFFCQRNETRWLRATGPPSRCSCKAKLINVLVVMLYESFCDFQELQATESQAGERARLGRHLGAGVRLLHGLLQRDQLVGCYLDGVEGQYHLLLAGLRDFHPAVPLTPTEKMCLKELLEVEVASGDGAVAGPSSETARRTAATEQSAWEDALWGRLHGTLRWDANIQPVTPVQP